MLREYCARHRLNTWFAFEEKEVQQGSFEEAQIATTDQAYAADIVIRLGVTVFPSGYRERSLEIVKAKNQGYRRGRHHYSIRGASARDRTALAAVDDLSKAGLGIVIYPSLATQLHLLANRDEIEEPLVDLWKTPVEDRQALPGYYHCLGLAGVDDALRRRNPSTHPGAGPRAGAATPAHGYLRGGTVSVLVSDLDSLATEIALHFALQGSDSEDAAGTLYITTLHRHAELWRMADRYNKLDRRPDRIWVRELKPEHISESKLLKDIEHWIDSAGKAVVGAGTPVPVQRVVFDNIYEIGAKFPLVRNNNHFLTALFEVLRKKGVASFIVDTVEVGEGRNPLDQSFAAGIADHVFVLRHVDFQSQTRKVFSVLKLAGYQEPPQLWELRQGTDCIHAEDRLDFFKGVLTAKPEPVEVTLSLYAGAPDSPLSAYLDAQQ